jgi:outer membrane protein assembly factor BamB
LVVSGRAVKDGASPAVAVLLAASTAFAQPAQPAPEHPFHPLQAAWSANVGVQPSAPPAVAGGRLLVPFANGDLAVFDVRTGGFLKTGRFATTLPLVADGARILVTGDAVVDAVRPADATGIWKRPLPAPAAFAPVARNGWAFVALANGALTALRTDTGAVVWTTPLGQPAAPPAVEGDRLYLGTSGGAVHAVEVKDGAVAWRAVLDGAPTALAAVEGHIFVSTAGRWLYALDRRGEVRWRFRIQGAAIGLAVDEDRVVAVMLDQSVRAFRIGRGAQAWRQELSFRPAAGPVLIGSSVLVTGYSPSVRILDRRTGANQGLYPLPLPLGPGGITLETLAAGPILVPGPTVFDDLVILVTQHGFLHAARRGFDPPATPLTAMPGAPLPAPQLPPGIEMPETAPASTPAPDPAAAPASPPSGDTPSRTPPAPPGR